MDTKQFKTIIASAFMVLSGACVTNCILAISGYTLFWRMQWPAVFVILLLASAGVGLDLVQRSQR